MRRSIAFALAVWLATTGLLTIPPHPAHAQDGVTLGDAPFLADGMVVAASGDDIVQAAAVPAVDISSRSASAAFYFSYYTTQPAIGWTGSQATCNAGTTNTDFKAAVIDRVAFYRAMAGVPSSIGLSATSSVSNQQAALMFSRNNMLSHTPASTWACYTSAGAQGAANSNIALGTYGVGAIDAYMKDPGSNNAAAGHRRWILFPQTQSFGTGDVPSGGGYPPANALWVWDSNINGARPSTRDGYVAWPPPGYVPYQVVYPRWSFSYPGASFGSATVTATLNGASVPVAIDSATATGYGENTIVFRLNGMAHNAFWANPGTDQTYTVQVSNVVVGGQSRTFTYNVTVFDPSTANPASATATPTRTPTASPTASRTPTRTGTPATATSTPTATHSPSTIPGGYAVGEQFRLTTSVNFRSGPGTTFAPIAVLPSGTIGTVTGAPVAANGFTFYPASVPGYGAGWLAGEFFARVATATPTRTVTTTPTTAATTTVPTVTRTPTTTLTVTRTLTAISTNTRTPTATPTVSRTATTQATATRVPGGFVAGDTVRTTAAVNFRSGPSTGSTVITVLAANITGTVTGSGVVSGVNTFYPVNIPGTGSGWIAGQYLTLVAGNTPTRTATASSGYPIGTTLYTTANLNIRTGPGTGFASLGIAPRGTAATVTGAPVVSGTAVWYPLQVPGIGAGWASSAYLSTTPPVQGPQLPTALTPSATASSTPTSTLTAVPPSETAIAPATATVVDTLTPAATAAATESETLIPTESSPPDETAVPTQAAATDPPAEAQPWLSIARIQRSPDSAQGQVLVDGDPSTVWFANGAGQPLAMFVLDLGQVSTISQIQWRTGESGMSGTLYVSVSSDNITWTDLDPTLAYPTEDGWFALDAPASAQYIRFVFVNDIASDWLGGIAEVRVIP